MTDTALLAHRRSATADRVLSPFEFWPGWLFYAPVVAQWIYFGLRFGDMSLPTAANPLIDTGGLCGESKSEILTLAGPEAREWIAPWFTFDAGIEDPVPMAEASGFGWPMVLKPDIGCNGTGVKLIPDAARLATAVTEYPHGVKLLVQKYVPEPGEAGLFYIRYPHEATGRVTSLTLKYAPSVTGDGRATLEALVLADKRAGRVPHLYLSRLGARRTHVPAAGEVVPLVFTGNHCKGSVFVNGADAITPALTRRVDEIARNIPGFHFGRIDVRYASEAALRLGQGFTIIEVNGAGSEATHIWDARCSLREAYATQFSHYRAAWMIGRANRAAGYKTSGLPTMYRKWRLQRRLLASYPTND